MADSGSESYTSQYVDPELVSRGPEKEMVVRLGPWSWSSLVHDLVDLILGLLRRLEIG